MENIVIKIRNELIASISSIDSWFDKDDALIDHKGATVDRTVRQLLQDAMLSNRYLLQIIDNGRNTSTQALVDKQFENYSLRSRELEDAIVNKTIAFNTIPVTPHKLSLMEVRYEIREQLDRCLIHLELLLDGGGAMFSTNLSVGELGNLDVYQSIYLLAIQVKQCLCQLDLIQKEYNREIESV